MKYQPFTIQLLYGSYGYKQEMNVGVDLGAKYIGLAITSQDTVLAKGDIQLRQDVKSNLETRKSYRRSRRNRKTRYREARFFNRISIQKRRMASAKYSKSHRQHVSLDRYTFVAYFQDHSFISKSESLMSKR